MHVVQLSAFQTSPTLLVLLLIMLTVETSLHLTQTEQHPVSSIFLSCSGQSAGSGGHDVEILLSMGLLFMMLHETFSQLLISTVVPGLIAVPFSITHCLATQDPQHEFSINS